MLFIALAAMTANAQDMKQWRDSLKVINQQIADHPDSLNLQLAKAAVNLQMLEWESAANTCGRVLEKDPNNLSALYYRAYAYNNMRRYELAKNDYARFLSMSPRNMEARLGLAYTYIKLERPNESMAEMNNLVEMFPDNALVYAARGELEKDLKQYDTALFDFDEALKRDPGNKDYTISKVDMLISLNRIGEAKSALDEAVKHGVPRGLLHEWYAKCR